MKILYILLVLLILTGCWKFSYDYSTLKVNQLSSNAGYQLGKYDKDLALNSCKYAETFLESTKGEQNKILILWDYSTILLLSKVNNLDAYDSISDAVKLVNDESNPEIKVNKIKNSLSHFCNGTTLGIKFNKVEKKSVYKK